jgi:hypothetical protein
VTGDVVMGGGSPFSGPVSGTVAGDVFSISYRGGRADLAVKGKRNERAHTVEPLDVETTMTYTYIGRPSLSASQPRRMR